MQQRLSTGLQALGVLVALILAVVTIDTDRHDKQVDRVLALHHELVTGPGRPQPR